MSNGDLPRAPIVNEILLAEAINGYVYSLLFFLPSKVGLPIPPAIAARQLIMLPRGGTYSFA